MATGNLIPKHYLTNKGATQKQNNNEEANHEYDTIGLTSHICLLQRIFLHISVHPLTQLLVHQDRFQDNQL